MLFRSKISSIIGSEDYEDLGNHSTEAMGETGLFSIAQVRIRHPSSFYFPLLLFLTDPFCRQAMLMTKGLMDRALHHETALERVRDKAKLAKEELL